MAANQVCWGRKTSRQRQSPVPGGVAKASCDCLFGFLAEECDEVVPVLALLQSTECHLGAGNVLFGVLEVVKLKQR